MLIPEAKVQEILERTDIVGLIGSRVELKRTGHTFKALCPFHGERTPSFIVNPDRRRFKCFGCGAGGDAISFVMKQDGKSFIEAAKDLAAAAGVRLEDAGDDRLQREKLDLRRVHQLANRFYVERIFDAQEGRSARAFLRKRGLTATSLKTFQLGLAPAAWDGFSKRAAKEGMLELALHAGLVNERGDKGTPAKTKAPPATAKRPVAQSTKPVAQSTKPVAPAPKPVAPAPKPVAPAPVLARQSTYDFFRARLMIPIRNAEGATVAFGGRILAGDDPRKFVNSRESPIYKKGELLYGIDQAGPTIRKTGQALLVEGYFDAILLHQAGLTNAVALCSASLTAEQVKLLRRFEAQEIVLILDGDDAGRRGVTRAAGALLATAMPTRVVMLPTGKDPDDYVLEVGGEAFKRVVAAAQPLTEHLIQSALPKEEGASFEDRLKGLAELKPILAQVPQGLERALFLTSLADRLGVPEAMLTKALQTTQPKPLATPGSSVKSGEPNRVAPGPSAGLGSRQRAGATAGSNLPNRSNPTIRPNRLLTEEALLLAHLIHDPELARLPQADEIEALTHQGLRAAAAALTEAVLDGTPLPKSDLLGALEPEVRRQVDELLLRVMRQSPQAHREEFLQRCALHREHLARTEAEELQQHLKELAQRIADLKRRKSGKAELDALIDEHIRLTQEKQAVSRARRERTASAVH